MPLSPAEVLAKREGAGHFVPNPRQLQLLMRRLRGGGNSHLKSGEVGHNSACDLTHFLCCHFLALRSPSLLQP